MTNKSQFIDEFGVETRFINQMKSQNMSKYEPKIQNNVKSMDSCYD